MEAILPIEQVDQEIQVLETLHTLAVTPSQEVLNAKINSPVQEVEKSLSRFINDVFDVTREDFELGRALNASLIDDLTNDKLNATQKIALFSAYQVNANDRMSKTIAPTLHLMTTRQQAEINAQAQIASAKISPNSTTTIAQLNQAAPKEVLQGIQQLNNLFELLAKHQKTET